MPNHLKETINKLKERGGNIKGEALLSDIEALTKIRDKKSVDIVLENMREMGEKIDLKEIKSSEWYPEYLLSSFIIVSYQFLGLTEKDIFEWGRTATKVSFIAKIILRHLVSIDKAFEECSNYWRKNYDFGNLVPVEMNSKDKYAVVRITDYLSDPLICTFHAGYFKGILEFILPSEKIEIKEERCIHRGDSYHEYLISWGEKE